MREWTRRRRRRPGQIHFLSFEAEKSLQHLTALDGIKNRGALTAEITKKWEWKKEMRMGKGETKKHSNCIKTIKCIEAKTK